MVSLLELSLNLVAIGYSGTVPPWVFIGAIILTICVMVARAYWAHKQAKRAKESSLHLETSKTAEEGKRSSSASGRISGSHGVRPKFRTLYGGKPLTGVIIGLGIIVGNVLFFSFVIPARTSGEIITTIALVIVGVLIAAFSNLIGLMRVSNARSQEAIRNGRDMENNENT